MTKSEALRFRMTPAELAALRSMAEERSCSVGAVVRWAVREAIIKQRSNDRQETTGGEAPEIKIMLLLESEAA